MNVYPVPWMTGGSNRWLYEPYTQGTDTSWDAWTAAGITITHTATTTGASQIWDAWHNYRLDLTTTSNVYPVWDEWNRTASLHSYSRQWAREGSARKAKPLPELTEKQKAAYERRRQITLRRADVAALRKRVANRRAEQLLIEQLNAEQREQWAKGREFHVETADGKRTYRIREGLAGNIYLVRDADRPRMQRTTRYCFHVYHPDGHVPNCDNVLAQKLLIEANEEAFLAEANIA